jgi:hypothetical protein
LVMRLGEEVRMIGGQFKQEEVTNESHFFWQ